MPRDPLLTANIDDSIVLTLFDIANELGKLGERASSKTGLTTQQSLTLLQIAGDPNFATPRDCPARIGPGIMASEIARARGFSRANVSMLVAQLLRMGLVSQTEQPDDRRRKLLTVTDAGRAAVADIKLARREANQNLFASLSREERKQLLRSLRACLERLWLVDRSGGPEDRMNTVVDHDRRKVAT
jgi:MarR family transcriptional regulator, transcriptional regulator for hemolysin